MNLMIFLISAYATLYIIYMMCFMIFAMNLSSYVTELYTSKWRFVNYIISAVPTTTLVFAFILYMNS